MSHLWKLQNLIQQMDKMEPQHSAEKHLAEWQLSRTVFSRTTLERMTFRSTTNIRMTRIKMSFWNRIVYNRDSIAIMFHSANVVLLSAVLLNVGALKCTMMTHDFKKRFYSQKNNTNTQISTISTITVEGDTEKVYKFIPQAPQSQYSIFFVT